MGFGVPAGTVFEKRKGNAVIFISLLICGLLLCLEGAGLLAVVPDAAFSRRGAAFLRWRGVVQGGLWAVVGLLALAGAMGRLNGVVSWFPLFGVDGPALPMLAVLSFAGGVTGTGRQGLACVLAALGLLALSPLVFCLLAGTALALLTRRGGWGLCLPFAVLPACVPADSVLSVPLLALSILQTGHAVGEQKGPVAMVPAFIGIFLLGRLLAETGAVPFVQQALMLACGGWVAWRGGLQALRGQQPWCVASGLAGAWYGGACMVLVLALACALDGADAFGATLRLAMGAPALGLVGLLWLSVSMRGPDSMGPGYGTEREWGRWALWGTMLPVSAMPPLGGFSVLWSLLVASDYSVQGASPATALGMVLFAGFQIMVAVLCAAGLLRAGALMRGGYWLNRGLPACLCAVVAALLSLVPGLWPSVADALVVGDSAPGLSVWGVFTVRPAAGESTLVPALLLLALVAAAGLAALLARFMGASLVPVPARMVVPWRQGAPVYSSTSDGMGAGQTEPVLPFAQAGAMLCGLEGGSAGWRLPRPSVLPVRLAVLSRYGRRWLFRGVAWSESHGMVLLVLLLGAGLLLGLFLGA